MSGVTFGAPPEEPGAWGDVNGNRENVVVGLHGDVAKTNSPRRFFGVPVAPMGILAAVALACTVLSASAGIANAAPQHLLQAVNVDVSPDGSLTAVASTDITRDSSVHTTTTKYAPRDVAGKLPVAISMSYAKNGKPGLNLADVAKTKGLVQIDVTVRDTTVTPTQVTYSLNGKQHSQQALVGVPMTVTASATLPKGTYGTVVQSAPGTTDPHTTNGVVSSASNGSGSVQWSALLAPPQLSPTTTFTLVEQTDHFVLPDITVAVTPGLQADPSVTGLLARTFGSQNSLLSQQNQAIALTTQINTTLGRVGSNLGTIQTALSGTATTLGQAATVDIRQTGTALQTSTTDLSQELLALKSSVGGTLQQAGGQSDSALSATVNALVNYLGLPASGEPVPPPPTPAASMGTVCNSTRAAGRAPTTLLGQLERVSTDINGISSDTGACLAATTKSLKSLIGTSATTCPNATLTCTIVAAGVKLSAAQGTFESNLSTLNAPVANTTAAVAGLHTAIAALATGLNTVTAPGGALTGLPKQIAALQTDLTQAGASAQTVSTEVATLQKTASALQTTASTLHNTVTANKSLATTDQNSLAGKPTYNTSPDGVGHNATEQITAAEQLVCSSAPPKTPGADATSVLLIGKDCAGNAPTDPGFDQLALPLVGPYAQKSLAAIIGQNAADWASIAAEDAGQVVAIAPGLTADLATLSTYFGAGGALQKDLDAITTALASGGGGSTSVSQLLTQLDKDANALVAPANACDPTGGSVNGVARCVGPVSSAGSIAAALQAVESNAGQPFLAAKKSVDNAAGGVASAGTNASTSLNKLLANLQTSLNRASTTQLSAGVKQLAAQQTSLLSTSGAVTKQNDAATTAAIASLDQSVGAANSVSSSAGIHLATLIGEVEADLGSGAAKTPTGILGAIQTNATETGIGAGDVAGAASNASNFRGLRLTDVAGNLLEQQQLRTAVQLAQSFPAFERTLPPGSTSTTVFDFHLLAAG